jgi:hypothetical protein
MAGTAMRHLRITGMEPDVVLGGGVFRATWRPFHERITAQVHAVAPNARIVRLAVPPVAGAAMLGLDEIGASRNAHARARSSLTHGALTRKNPPRRARS